MAIDFMDFVVFVAQLCGIINFVKKIMLVCLYQSYW